MESPRGTSIRIQHLTAAAAAAAAAAAQPPPEGRSRFPKLDECAHFHYDFVELSPLQVCLYEEELKPLASEDTENKYFHVSVTSLGKTWVLRRSYDNFRMLDSQLHRCIYDRKFSGLLELPPEDNVQGVNHEESVRKLLSDYLTRFSHIAGNLINCGPVLNWLELDNRGRRLLVPDGDNCPINTPAVAAAYAVKRYTAQAGDEISFEVGDMISVIDMPPPEESVWWRGKRGFQVGFFPCECVAVIGDKVPRNLQLPTPPLEDQPSKPVLRKHGKLIAFFRSFILSRPSRRRLKQSGILKERVFGCDLGEHLLNSGHEIPMVLKCCAEFIETNGIVDGIYRLSGVNSNIQKLRNAFDEDRVPALYEDEAILQDIHSVASLLKMYFRELPNPLCTYQLYHTFVNAVQSSQEEGYRLLRMRDAVQKLPPPHYRTLEYLMRHLARVAEHGHTTGMTPRNVAIVWAPNLLRCKELEVGGVAALQGVGVQAVVTEFLVCYTDLIFSDGLPPITLPLQEVTPKRSRPKSLAISTPTKLLSLEEARSRALSAGKTDQEYIEVGGGPSNLPAKYHTVIELPGSGRKRSGSKRSPLGWKSFFSKSGRKSNSSAPQRKASTPSELGLNQEKAVTELDLTQGRRRLRPVKSAESLASGANSSRNSAALEQAELSTPDDVTSPSHGNGLGKASGHNRSVSHDSYFDSLAETPMRTQSASRPSQLPEEENEENFSSSLDLSEIHLNFDLEESEMRIFSEDETLVSTSAGSGSFVSQGSPRVGAFRRAQQNTAAKRLPMRELPPPRARPEDSFSGCISTDPSPKKQKTCSSPGSSRSKRSRLEEQLGPAAEFRYIDSQSPENQQMLVQADVHEHFAPERKFSASTPNSMGCSKTSPSLADATVSDNESFTVLSSGLTTPDTPLLVYTPLRDDTNSSTTTPDYENLLINKMPISPGQALPGGPYERLATPTPSPTGVPPSIDCMSDTSPITNDCVSITTQYENIPLASPAASGDLPPAEASYVNMAATSVSKTDIACSPIQSPLECHITIVYENVLSPKKSPLPSYEDMLSPEAEEPKDSFEGKGDYEVVSGHSDSAPECSSPGKCGESSSTNVYQNVPHALELQQEEEHLYEDIQLTLSTLKEHSVQANQSATFHETSNLEDLDPDRQVYQQVKNFRRSVHEVNQLLDHVEMEGKEIERALVNVSQEVSENVKINELPCGATEEIGGNSFGLVQKQSETSAATVEESSTMRDSQDDGTYEDVNEVLHEKVTATEELCSKMDVEVNLSDEPSVDEVPSYNDSSQADESVKDHTQETVPTPSPIPPSNSSSSPLPPPNSSSSPLPPLSPLPSSSSLTPAQLFTSSPLPPKDTGVEQLLHPHSPKNRDCTTPRASVRSSPDFLSDFSFSRRSMTASESPGSSPEHRSSLGSSTSSLLDSNRRKFESEIGRDILHERKMKQELQELRSSTGALTAVSPLPSRHSPSRKPASTVGIGGSGGCTTSSSTSNVKELLSRFESSPTEESAPLRGTTSGALTPQPARRSDPTPARPCHTASLPPCMRVRAAKAARHHGRLAGLTPLSVSLDGERFLASSAPPSASVGGGEDGCGGAPLVRVRTSPDINLRAGSEPAAPTSRGSAVATIASLSSAEHLTVLKNVQNTVDLDDPERRQRIEKYKEERRMFLREKYRSESFREREREREEVFQRLKQKAQQGKTLSSPGDEPLSLESTRSGSGVTRCNRSDHGDTASESDLSLSDDLDLKVKASKGYDLLSDENSRCRSRFFSLSQVGDESQTAKTGTKVNAPREGWGPRRGSTTSNKSLSPTHSLERRLSPRKTSAADCDPAAAHAELEKRVLAGSKSPRHSTATPTDSSVRTEPELPEIRVPGKSFGGPEKRRSNPETQGRSVELRLSPKSESMVRSPVSDRRESPRRRAASDSPSFFIKDMAALFESHDVDNSAPGRTHPTPGRTHSGKLSST